MAADTAPTDNLDSHLKRLEEERHGLDIRLKRLEEESSRLRAITQENQLALQYLRQLVDHFAQTALKLHGDEEGVKEEVQRLKKLVDGDPGLGIAGLRKESKELEIAVERLTMERDALYNQVKGARLLAGLIGASAGGAIGFVMGLFGG